MKLLVEEQDSDIAAGLWSACSVAVSSRLAYPEVRAALAAAGRQGRLDPRHLTSAVRFWERLWSEIAVVELTPGVASTAGGLADRHELRGADAVHLASLLALEDPDLVFAVWDARLRCGARSAGFLVAPADP